MVTRYRETSRTRTPEGEEVYADCEIEVTENGAVYHVQSLTSPNRISVHFDTVIARDFFQRLLEAKQTIMAHDRREFSRRPIPRPRKTVGKPTCPDCGGSGVSHDDTTQAGVES